MIQSLQWSYRAWRYRLKLERSEIAWLLSTLKPGQTAVDIGAHKGAYTWWMAKRVTNQGRVFAFEPQPGLAKRLDALVKSRKLHQVTVEQMGMSRTCEEMELRMPERGYSPGASFEKTPDARGGQKITVPVTSLDQYFGESSIHIDLIKCDSEGHELEIFKGGEQTLRACQPHLLFECEARHRGPGGTAEVFTFLHAMDYQGYFFSTSGIRPIDEFDEARHQARPGSPQYVNNFLFTQERIS